MNGLFLTVVVLGVATQNIVRKAYTEKTGGRGAFFYAALLSFVAMLFFLVLSGGFKWESGILLYAVGFSVSYATANVASSFAVACGPLSLTALAGSYSLLIPTFYGLIFLGDSVSFGLIPGLVFLVISLFLINKTDENTVISFRWIIFAILSFVGNGMCSTVQKMQQVVYGDTYQNEFMIIALALSALVLGICALFSEGSGIKTYAKKGWYYIVIGGVANGIVNLLVMLLNNRNFPVSLLFPIVSAGGIIITYFVSKWIYKEQLSKAQLVGFAFGVVAVVLLNM